MQIRKFTLNLLLSLGCAALCSAFPAAAQEAFPNKPIHLIVPYPAGGLTDQLARALQEPMQQFLKQPVIVENKTGAGGIIGTGLVASSPKDGYTLVFGNTGPFSVAPQARKTSYDPVKDFAPISLVCITPMMLAVPTSSPINTFPEFLAQARKSGDSWNFGSTGQGSMSHLAGELFNHLGATKLKHIPYNGGAQVALAFGAGDLQAAFVTGPESMPMIQAKKIKYLAVGTPKPTSVVPGLPAVAEYIPGFASSAWFGVLAPSGTPDAVLKKINAAVVHAVGTREYQNKFAGLYVELRSSSPEEFTDFMREERQRIGSLLQNVAIKFD